MAKIHGAASAGENLTGNINFYTIYVKQLDMTATGNVAEQSQQNFDDVVNLISLVAQPIVMNNPLSVTLDGLAPSMSGSGMLIKFAVDHPKVFERSGDNVSVLKELFEGVQIENTVLQEGTNIEFVMSDIL